MPLAQTDIDLYMYGHHNVSLSLSEIQTTKDKTDVQINDIL